MASSSHSFAMPAACYHCGLPVPTGLDLSVRIQGRERAMCCIGCQSVASAIIEGGLEDYYARRDAMPDSQREAVPVDLQESGLFDHPALQKNFVQPVGEHEREAALILEGVNCAACVWLNERHIALLPGVTAITINYTTRRARVRWDERKIQLSEILNAIAVIGYRAHPYDAAQADAAAKRERKAALWRLFVAGFGMMQVMMYAVPVYLANGDMTPDIEQLMRWASLILTLPVVLYSAAPFFRNAWRDITLGRVGMDVPVALGVGTAFIASMVATLSAGTGPSDPVYYDSVTMFVFLLLGGRYLELMARQRAARGIEAINRAQPTLAFRLTAFPLPDGERIAAIELSPGDIVLIKPGETVPADGQVIDGISSVDESVLTGESRPVQKYAGETVIGGSINGGSPLFMQVNSAGAMTRLAAIQRLIAQAASERPPMVELADRIAARFVIGLLLVALASAAVWWSIEPARALWIFVAILVVSCPCALSLATPAAITVATGALAARGVLVTRASAIESLAYATHFVFDKTGTLTEGRPRMLECWTSGESPRSVLALAAAMEQMSEHPYARALIEASETSWCPEVLQVKNLRALAGLGLTAEHGRDSLRLGSLKFCQELHGQVIPPRLAEWQAAGDMVVGFADAHGWRAGFRFGDTIRPEAAAMVARLKASGVKISIFSGDDASVVQRVADALGIEDARGNMSPEDKHAALKALQAAGAVVAMTGDGVNDAPVLAQAQVSIAMGNGADLARSQAGIVLLGSDLHALADAVVLVRQTLRIVRQNLGWAFAYNAIFIPMAMFGWVTPWLAGVGMSVSSLAVVLNSLRLQAEKTAEKGPTTIQQQRHVRSAP
ncbi:MAG TPA: heavy metal translocating P-type ATPase [Rhodocyclaceae bacterium]|jgi:Cu2+-exporting ATPase|nr:heavy metal translocating P-type ATPase [Rhodocyclaceae bacterium]